MSLPITAVGPLKVLTKPIFTEFCAQAGAAASASMTLRPIDNRRILDSPLFCKPAGGKMRRTSRPRNASLNGRPVALSIAQLATDVRDAPDNQPITGTGDNLPESSAENTPELNTWRFSRCRSRAFCLGVIVVLGRTAALARFRQFRVCPPAFVGILLPIDRPDMRRVSIEIRTRDPELLAVGVDPLPQNFARDPALRPRLALDAHEIGRKPVAI